MTYFKLIRASLSLLETTFFVFSRPRPASPGADSHRRTDAAGRHVTSGSACWVTVLHQGLSQQLPRVQSLTFATGGQGTIVVRPSFTHISQRHGIRLFHTQSSGCWGHSHRKQLPAPASGRDLVGETEKGCGDLDSPRNTKNDSLRNKNNVSNEEACPQNKPLEADHYVAESC